MLVQFKSGKVYSKCTSLMQGPQNPTKKDISSIAAGKYTTSKKNMAKLLYNFFAQYNNYISVLMASKTTTNK